VKRPQISVIKVGGSLFDWDLFPVELDRWLSRQNHHCQLLVAGGGALVDTIREYDRRFELSAEEVHHLCIEAMSVTSQMLSCLLPGMRRVTRIEELQQVCYSSNPKVRLMIEFSTWLNSSQHELSQRLPASWDVTSDSIAAGIAGQLGSCELTLLKSCTPPAAQSLSALAEQGYVDRHFPNLAASLPLVRLVNLRDQNWVETRIVHGEGNFNREPTGSGSD